MPSCCADKPERRFCKEDTCVGSRYYTADTQDCQGSQPAHGASTVLKCRWRTPDAYNGKQEKKALRRRSQPGGRAFQRRAGVYGSHVEPEVHYVAVVHDIVLAFDPQHALVFAGGLRAVFDEVFVGDDLGAYEAALEVAVYDPGGLRGL